MMIKKLIYILILIILIGNSAFAKPQTGYLEFDGFPYELKQGDDIKFLKDANNSMLLSEKPQPLYKKIFYLQNAMKYYFLLSKANPTSIDAQIGLGRVYDELKADRHAKEHFFNAINFNNKNPNANFYFGNFYYKRNDLITALYYYKIAYNNGYANNYYLNYRMGIIYEKLADNKNAKSHYTSALKLNSQDLELRNKIRLLDELNYSQSQYYLYNGEKKRESKRDK